MNITKWEYVKILIKATLISLGLGVFAVMISLAITFTFTAVTS